MQEEDRKRFAHEAAEKEKLEAVPKYTDKEEEPDTPPRDNRNRNARWPKCDENMVKDLLIMTMRRVC